jgi:hypothetical protein
MCKQYLHCIHPPTPFPHHLPLPTGPNLPWGRTCSILLFYFVEEKNDIFACLR